MLNLDPSILDQEKIRLTKRKRLMLGALLPILFLSLGGVFFLRTGIYNIPVAANDYDTIRTFSSIQLVANLIEPFLPYYNRGTAILTKSVSSEDLKAAEEDFQNSLQNNPAEEILCSVYGNLSLSIELQGDLAIREKNYGDAIVYFNRAESVLYENNCANKSNPDESKDALSKKAVERLTEKRRAAVEAANNIDDKSDKDEDNPDSKEQQVSDEDIKKLQEIQKENRKRSGSALRYSIESNGARSNHDFNAPNF